MRLVLEARDRAKGDHVLKTSSSTRYISYGLYIRLIYWISAKIRVRFVNKSQAVVIVKNRLH